jgi:hypothetical protein
MAENAGKNALFGVLPKLCGFAKTGWWRMQSCETGLQLRNREFSKDSGSKQALTASVAADHADFALNLNRLDQPLGTFL